MASLHKVCVYIYDAEDSRSVQQRLETAVADFCSICNLTVPQPKELIAARTERGKPYFPHAPQLHFSISHSGAYWSCALSDQTVGFDLQETEQPKKLLLRIINESILKNPHYELIAKGLLFELLATLAREDFESKRKSDVIKHNPDAFLQVIEKITKNPQISNEECAKDCFLSVSQFIRVFKKKFNITPHQYKLNILINLAKDLLTNSDLSLTEIAKNLGFDAETLYFNTLFKKQTGMSPTEFRNKHKSAPDAQAVSIPYDQSALIDMEK